MAAPARAATPASVAASSAAPGANAGTSSGGSGAGGPITEIIPSASPALGAQASAARSAGLPAIGSQDAWASADPCVNVFVRPSKVDGREVVSVDLHGDGLIKGAVPPQLAGQLLARAGPEAGGARAACVPPALAQRLFDPVINVAAVDPAVKMARVGDRWVLAGNDPPAAGSRSERVQLAAATTTRGAAKKQAKQQTKKQTRQQTRKPATPRPVQVSYNIYP